MRIPVLRATAFLAAVAGIAFSIAALRALTAGIAIESMWLGDTPVTLFRPSPAGPSAPVVVVAHGFAGSQQLMLPFATTLARAGSTVLTFDFPGHGRNPEPLAGGLGDVAAMSAALAASLDRVVAFGRGLGPSVSLVGHSMAAEAVVRYAQAHADIRATVAVSFFTPAGEGQPAPANLLIVDGALEPAAMVEQGRALLAAGDPALASAGGAAIGKTYGDFAAGTARRIVEAEGAEHIGILYSRSALLETVAWLRQAAGATSARDPGRQDAAANGSPDDRGRWLGLLVLCVVVLAWVLAPLLPVLTARDDRPATGAPHRFVVAIVAPAVLAPFLATRIHGGWMPILVADYLLLHMALYGALTLFALRWVAPRAQDGPGIAARIARPMFGACVAIALAWWTLGIALPIDAWAYNLAPSAGRPALIAALLCGTLPWLLGDELLTRGPSAPRGASIASKAAFLLSLALAVALDPARLFFLAIIAPAVLMLLVLHGLVGRWIARRTGEPLVAAVAHALVFAWFIGAAFPIVAAH